MTTICSCCGNTLDENKEKFILCSRCRKFIPKGANSYKGMKGGNKQMVDKEVKTEKKKPMSIQVKELLAEGKSVQEINQITGIKVSYITAVIKKKDKLVKKE